MSHNPDRTGIGALNTDESEFLAHSLDLFSRPPIESSLLHGKTLEHNPVNAITNSGPFEFLLPSHAYNEYTYLPLTRLEGEIRVTKEDGAALANTDDVSVANFFPSTLFRQVECELNGHQIADLSSPTYPYKVYIESILSYGKEAKLSHLQASVFYEDQVSKEAENTKANNTGLLARSKLISPNKSLYFSTQLHLDFFHSERLLPPGCNLKIKLIRSSDNFSLIAPSGSYKIEIKELKLFTRRITVHDSVVNGHSTLFEKSNAIFPTPMSRIKTYVLTSGISQITLPNIFRGKLPRQIIFGIVSSGSFNGEITSNPFCFKDFGVNYVALKVNGNTIPSTVFQPDFEKGKYVREYRHFLDSCGIAHENASNSISLKQFGNGKTFFVYDLSPDMCNAYHNHMHQNEYLVDH